MQRALEPAGARELGVERLGGLQRIGHGGIVVGGVGLRALAAQVERDEGVEPAGVLDRLDVAELEAGGRIDGAFDAGPVIGRDALEVVVDQLRRRQLSRQDRPVDVGDGRFLDLERPFFGGASGHGGSRQQTQCESRSACALHVVSSIRADHSLRAFLPSAYRGSAGNAR